jgi:predicted RNA-binding Zn ribbon-like protein
MASPTGLLATGDSATHADVPRVQAVREALRGAMAANQPPGPIDEASLRTINRAARDAKLTASVTAQARSPLHPGVGGVQGAMGWVLAAALGSMDDGTWTRLKVCANDTCRGAFYDHSRARTGRWCSMDVCGNRAKQRAWRERQP